MPVFFFLVCYYSYYHEQLRRQEHLVTYILLKRLSLLPLVGFILLHNLALCNLHVDAILLISVLFKTLSIHTSYITKATKEISWILMCLFRFLVHKSCQTIIRLIKLPLDTPTHMD